MCTDRSARSRRRRPALLSALGAAAVAAGCATTAPLGGGEAPAARVRIPPFVWWDRDRGGGREVRNFLGFLYDQRAESAASAPDRPSDSVVSRRSLRILWPFYGRESLLKADGMRTETRSLLPFVWTTLRSERSGLGTEYSQRRVVVPPLLFSLRSDNYDPGQLEYEFLWPLGRYFRGERNTRSGRMMVRSFRFLPFVSYERARPAEERRRPGRPDERPPAAHTPGERVRLWVLKPLFGYDRDADARRRRTFLLGGIAGEEGRPEDERTLGLIAAEKGPATDYEVQALWQFFMVKRSGAREIVSRSFAPERPSDMWRATKWLFGGSPRRSVKLGPILGYEADWSADRMEFSVLFGLVSYSRAGRDRRGRFLWVIPWRP